MKISIVSICLIAVFSIVAGNVQAAAGAATVDELGGLPPGYHRMPDGTVMANSPSTATAPPGYHLMPDGTLMANDAVMDDAAIKEHSHGGGMWMTDFQTSRMYMGGMLDTTTELSGEDILATGSIYADKYNMTPTDMTMEMQMLMLMYHNSQYMAMVMLHYMSNDMGMLMPNGAESTMSTQGVGDSIASIEFPLKKFHAKYSFGLSIPTGSITEHGPMGNMGDVRYPYGMQLGSGTYDLIMGAGYERRSQKVTYAAGLKYLLRTGENSEGYRLGNRSTAEGSMRYHFSSTLNGDINVSYMEVGEMVGQDDQLSCTDSNCMSPAADYANTGGKRADLSLGFKYENAHMTSLAFNFTQPFYQNLTGPQMRTDWITSLQFGYMF